MGVGLEMRPSGFLRSNNPCLFSDLANCLTFLLCATAS
uniref:Uncharacterized protein n=1 Tax=Rhizophora mucronata TaxID=61149 RepID=A0A2P2J0D6_RHIMU